MRHPWLTLSALLGWAGLSVQLYLILLMRWQEQASLIGGLVNAFSYFTVLSNTLVATVLSYAAFGREGAARRWFLSPATSSGIATCIVLVAITYSLLLRHLWQPQGWQRLADGLLHDIMPLLYVLYWWFQVPKGTLRWRHLPLWALVPIAYFAFSLLRGHVIGVYPYPFIDVASLGHARVMLNALAMLAAFLGVGMLVLGLDHWQGRRLATARSHP
ncbi:hypothetical protein G7009_16885 [Pseudomonas capeferrum]|uniref:Pr6Pr family membrane protein n=1 Tax=Pseudomonas capeferrum TaxID=1495066 RepID=UPI0015E2B19C|nr:Pr6Pr family membrane protein [Pseudomonas capeferrum]MBA1203405.1 hypothetical protein [Pseudomonas capeferrum]